MAVPKKRTSKSKRSSRLANWTNKAVARAEKAISIANSIMTKRSTSFISSINLEDTGS